MSSLKGGGYTADAIAAIESISGPTPNPTTELYPDRNIFEWYEKRLPKELPSAHLIDWGAGVGRFAPLFLNRRPRRLTLVEPSPSGYERLRSTFEGMTRVEVVQSSIGGQVSRCAPPSDVFHFCTFVINCLDEPREAFQLLSESVHPQERLIVFTNVFIPPSLAARLRWDHVLEGTKFDLLGVETASERQPRSTTFANQIIESGAILTDSVHTIFEYQALLRDNRTWQVVSTSLLPPCGFRHVLRPGDDYGELVFAVMNIELLRTED
jgi:hypothetical protein